MLTVSSVDKTFFPGTANERRALTEVDLHLEQGDFVTVIGSNGAGKSTLLNIISGDLAPDDGTVTIAGRDVTRLKDHQRASFVGRVFQDPMAGTAPHLSIQENMAIADRRGTGRWLRAGVTRAKKRRFAEELAALELGLEHRLTAKVGLLSGGQRQALTLLMASLKRPKLLLLDEHTAALDPKTAAKVLELSDRIVAENELTTMMVTHNMKDAIVHGNRLIMMYDGNIVIDVSGEEKKKLTVPDLLDLFSKVSGSDEADDKMLLS